ncbi:hypothetical protein GM676_20870 [Duganella radicis]|uniref:Uncharacterized protein n=1 Tax=Duganella radicis TaxID=551988 RepID=A0A6L6PM42_9BURK|nr:hypothetical protein [Duganella radicis]
MAISISARRQAVAVIRSLALTLILAGCDAKKNDVEKLKMTSAMRPHCIGHSLIDLPDSYTSSPGALGIFVPYQMWWRMQVLI